MLLLMRFNAANLSIFERKEPLSLKGTVKIKNTLSKLRFHLFFKMDGIMLHLITVKMTETKDRMGETEQLPLPLSQFFP